MTQQSKQFDSAISEIVLFHSNDLHSHLEAAARIATIIQYGREQYGEDSIIAVDVGDHMDRMRMETEGTDGYLHQEIFEATKYDVVTLGNNEGLTFTAEQLDHLYRDRSFEVICCNLERVEGFLPSWLSRSTIVERNGLKIGFIAATAHYPAFYSLLEWNVLEPISEIKKEAERLRKQCDVIILMSHLGIRLDEKIADECEGIDIILGSHTHHIFDPPEWRNGTLMCAAKQFGSHLGKIILQFNKQTRHIEIKGEVIPTAAYSEHSQIMSIIERNQQLARTKLNRIVTVLEQPLEASYTQESALPNLLAAGLRNWCGAEIGIVNSGQLLGGLAIGPVTVGELHGICPSPINPCVMTIRGNELWTALEQSLDPEYQHMKLKGFGFRGEKLGMLAVDGMEITYRWIKNKAIIQHIHIQGEPIDKNKNYRVATIDMFTFKVGYISLANFDDVHFYLPEFIRHVLEKELQFYEHIIDCKSKRWIQSN